MIEQFENLSNYSKEKRELIIIDMIIKSLKNCNEIKEKMEMLEKRDKESVETFKKNCMYSSDVELLEMYQEMYSYKNSYFYYNEIKKLIIEEIKRRELKSEKSMEKIAEIEEEESYSIEEEFKIKCMESSNSGILNLFESIDLFEENLKEIIIMEIVKRNLKTKEEIEVKSGITDKISINVKIGWRENKIEIETNKTVKKSEKTSQKIRDKREEKLKAKQQKKIERVKIITKKRVNKNNKKTVLKEEKRIMGFPKVAAIVVTIVVLIILKKMTNS